MDSASGLASMNPREHVRTNRSATSIYPPRSKSWRFNRSAVLEAEGTEVALACDQAHDVRAAEAHDAGQAIREPVLLAECIVDPLQESAVRDELHSQRVL